MILDLFRNIDYGIMNLWQWKKVIWNDRLYDYEFLLIIMKKKLELMENHFRYDGHLVDHVKDANNMKKLILTLDRLIKDEYIFNTSNYKEEEYLIKQDLDYMCNIIKKHIRSWWD